MFKKELHTRARRLVKLLPIILVLGACATGTIRQKVLTLPTIEGADYVGMETCAGCHEDKAADFEGNVHSRLADFELLGVEKGCESCHGAGSLHVAGGGDTDKINHPAKLAADQSAAICDLCHSGGETMDWTHSEHAMADVACTDCHAMHGEDLAKANLKQKDPELCYGCHQEQQAKANFPSHHPIKEGKMNCSSCHNPHAGLQTDEDTRDLCLECHARYQGPFVFEHAPVEEGCNICHDPHGTVANNLLVQNEPFLCLQCHESHFHVARIGGTASAANVAFSAYNPDGTLAGTPVAGTGSPPSGGDTPKNVASGTFVDPANPPATVQITNGLADPQHSWQQGFGTKCTVCHGVVHGSDLPSQSAPSVVDEATTTNNAGSGDGQGFPDGGGGLTR